MANRQNCCDDKGAKNTANRQNCCDDRGAKTQPTDKTVVMTEGQKHSLQAKLLSCWTHSCANPSTPYLMCVCVCVCVCVWLFSVLLQQSAPVDVENGHNANPLYYIKRTEHRTQQKITQQVVSPNSHFCP